MSIDSCQLSPDALFEYCTFVDPTEESSHSLCQAKAPQSAVDVKRIHVMFQSSSHENGASSEVPKVS